MRTTTQATADATPRYQQPMYEDEPKSGACWNCDHMVEVKIGGKTHCLCVVNRDVNASGDVYLAEPDRRNCDDWVDYE